MSKPKFPLYAAMLKIKGAASQSELKNEFVERVRGSKPENEAVFNPLADKDGYLFYIMATEDPAVHVFEDLKEAVDYFEKGWHRGLRSGGGFWAGAIIHWMQTLPRVFKVNSLDELMAVLGERVSPVHIDGMATRGLIAFECKEQALAKKIYDEGFEPSLVEKEGSSLQMKLPGL